MNDDQKVTIAVAALIALVALGALLYGWRYHADRASVDRAALAAGCDQVQNVGRTGWHWECGGAE